MSKARRQVPKAKSSDSEASREDRLAFGKRLEDAMRWARVGTKDLAEKGPWNPVTVTNWRKGRKTPSEPALARVAGLLGVSLKFLKEGVEPMVEGGVAVGEGGEKSEVQAARGVREPLAESYAAVPTASLVPPIVIPSDPSQRMASDHIWAKYTARAAQMRHEGAPLDHTEVIEWLDEMWRASKEDQETVRLSLQQPNGKHG